MPTKKDVAIWVGLVVVIVASALSYPYFSKTPVKVEKPKDRVEHDCVKGQTVLESLTSAGNEVKIKDTSAGTAVLAINGLSQTAEKTWDYSVSSEAATKSPDQYTCKNSEKILWELK